VGGYQPLDRLVDVTGSGPEVLVRDLDRAGKGAEPVDAEIDDLPDEHLACVR